MRKVSKEKIIKPSDGFAMKYVCELLQCISIKAADGFAKKLRS